MSLLGKRVQKKHQKRDLRGAEGILIGVALGSIVWAVIFFFIQRGM